MWRFRLVKIANLTKLDNGYISIREMERLVFGAALLPVKGKRRRRGGFMSVRV